MTRDAHPEMGSPIAANEPHAPLRFPGGLDELLERSEVCRSVLAEMLAEMLRDEK